MSWLWPRWAKLSVVTPSSADVTDTPMEVVDRSTAPDLLPIQGIIKQLDRYGIANASANVCSIGELIAAYAADFVFNAKKRDPFAAYRLYTMALEFSIKWSDSSVLLITIPNDALWETAINDGHPPNLKIVVLTASY